MLSHCLVLCDPRNSSLPGFSVHGIFQVRLLEWFAISYSSGSYWSRNRTCISCVSCIGRQILYNWTTKESTLNITLRLFNLYLFIIFISICLCVSHIVVCLRMEAVPCLYSCCLALVMVQCRHLMVIEWIIVHVHRLILVGRSLWLRLWGALFS